MPAWLNLYLFPRCILLEKCLKIEHTQAHRHTHRSYIYTFRGRYVSPGCTLRQMHGRQAVDAHKLGLKTSRCPTWTSHRRLLTDTKQEKRRDGQEGSWIKTCASHIRASFDRYRVMMNADRQDSQLSRTHHINCGNHLLSAFPTFPAVAVENKFLSIKCRAFPCVGNLQTCKRNKRANKKKRPP